LVASIQASSQGIDVNRALDRAYDAISDNLDQSSDRLVKSVNRSRSSNQSQTNQSQTNQTQRRVTPPTNSGRGSYNQLGFSPDSICLVGSWQNSQNPRIPETLDIRKDGQIFLNGVDMSDRAFNSQSQVTVSYVNESLLINMITNGVSWIERYQYIDGDLHYHATIDANYDLDVSKYIRDRIERGDLDREGVFSRTTSISAECISRSNNSSTSNREDSDRGTSIVEGLESLNELHQQGVLSDEEFNAAKRRLLGL